MTDPVREALIIMMAWLSVVYVIMVVFTVRFVIYYS